MVFLAKRTPYKFIVWLFVVALFGCTNDQKNDRRRDDDSDSSLASCAANSVTTGPCKVDNSGVAVSSTFGNDITSWTNPSGTTTVSASIPNGFYANQDVQFTETNLLPGNIANGVSIFGVVGTASGIPAACSTSGLQSSNCTASNGTYWTSSACTDDALNAGECTTAAGRYVYTSAFGGRSTNGANVTGANGTMPVTIPSGWYTGAQTLTCADTDLTASNICTGVTIFNTAGSAVCLGAAGTGTISPAGKICTGYYAYGADGTALQGTRNCLPSDGNTPTIVDDFDDSSINANWTQAAGAWTESSSVGYAQYTTDSAVPAAMYYNVSGSSSWADYTVTVNLKLIDDDYGGVAFRVQNGANFYAFRIYAQAPTRQFVKNVNGTLTILATESAAIATNTNYQLKVVASGSSFTFYLDGVMLFGGPVNDSTYSSGSVGFYSQFQSDTRFYSINVLDGSSATLLDQSYATMSESDATTYAMQWRYGENSNTYGAGLTSEFWTWRPAVNAVRNNTAGGVYSYLVRTDTAGTTDFTAEVDIGTTDDDGRGIVFRYTDVNNWYGAFFVPETASLYIGKKVAGTFSTLQQVRTSGESVHRSLLTTRNKIKVSMNGTRIRVYLDGTLLADFTDSTFASGKIGLLNWSDGDAYFRSFRVYPAD